MRHELLTSDELQDLANDCVAHTDRLNDEQNRSLAAMKLTLDEISCMPANLVKAQVLAGAQCEHAWRKQRTDNDWKGFLVNFEEVVKLSREEAKIRQEASQTATPYDALFENSYPQTPCCKRI